MLIEIAKIKIGDRLRTIKSKKIELIADSIKEIGLLNPVSVVADDDGYRLVAGHHRVEAMKKLGRSQIEANVLTLDNLRTRLAEIDENLVRAELDVLEESEHMAERKKVYEGLYPQTKQGAAQALGANRALGHDVEPDSGLTSFVDDTAQKTGISKSTIKENLQIAAKIDDGVKDIIKDTEIADSKTDLLELSKLDPIEQQVVMEQIAESGKEKKTPREVVIAMKIPEEVRDKIRDTKIATSERDLLALTRLEPAKQEKVVDMVLAKEAKDIRAAITNVRREEHADAIERARKFVEPTDSDASDGEAEEDGPELSAPAPQLTPGTFVKLGRHTLYVGDTTDKKFIDGCPAAELSFADPPYGVGKADWDSELFWKHDYLAGKSKIVMVTPGISNIFEFAGKTEMPYKWSIACWVTNGMTRGAVGFGNWIYVALFSKEESINRNAQDFLRTTIDNSTTADTGHESRKPLGLLTSLLRAFSGEGATVIDPFLGSGTTLWAAEATGRVCYGGELDVKFCEQIIERFERETGIKAVVVPE